MRIALIAAVARNDVIGRDGAMPWHLPADLRHFKETTLGKPVVMGRRTHQAIGRPLQGRTNIVITRDRGYRAPGCTVVHSPEEAIAAARAATAPTGGGAADEILVIGGGSVYAAFLPLAERIYLTRVDGEFAGDTHFPVLDPAEWRETSRRERPADARNPYACTFLVLDRRK